MADEKAGSVPAAAPAAGQETLADVMAALPEGMGVPDEIFSGTGAYEPSAPGTDEAAFTPPAPTGAEAEEAPDAGEKPTEPAAEAQKDKEAEVEPKPAWDPERQKKDEEEARKGRSKADVVLENERLLQENERLAAALEARQKAGAEATSDDAEKAPTEPTAEELGLLPEEDQYGDPVEANKAINVLKRQNWELRRSLGTIAEERQQVENAKAFRSLVDAACKGREEIRNDLIAAVNAEWKQRGYTRDNHPSPLETEYAISALANKLELERVKTAASKAKPAAQPSPAPDTAKGGRVVSQPKVHKVMTLKEHVRAMREAGEL